MLCNFANTFPNFIGNLLERERGLRRSFREETLTDLWVASLVAMRSFGLYADLANEAETGADLEIWFLSAKKDYGVGFVIQAKRTHCRRSGTAPFPCTISDWKRHRFEELDHAAGENRPKGSQARDLTRAAERSGRAVYPLYAFYNPSHVSNHSGWMKGVMLADGHDVRRCIVLGRWNAWRARSITARGGIRRGNAEFKTLASLEHLLFPLARMFCHDPWTPIRRLEDEDIVNRSILLRLMADQVGVATIPDPQEVAREVSQAIRRSRETHDPDVLSDLPVPTTTDNIPRDILHMTQAGESGMDMPRPDVPVARYRLTFVATLSPSGDGT